MIDLSLEAFADICKGVQQAAASLGYQVVLGDGKSDPAVQSQLMDTYPTQGVKMVVVIAQDPGSLQASINRAQQAGIEVVALGTQLPTANVQVVSDFAQEGKTAGMTINTYVQQHLGGHADALVTNYPPTAVLVTRAQGTIDALNQGGIVKVADLLSANSRQEGIQAVQAALQKDPNIRVMSCISDDACLGGAQAFQDAGIPASQLFLIGNDATSSAYQALTANNTGFKATMGYGLHVFGAAGVIRGVDCLKGEHVQQTVTIFEALDLDPVGTYNSSHFSEFITVSSSTLAKCPPF
jgi:ABC-type sugar transport system substrate-binding protein